MSNPYPQLAKVALDVMATATIRAGDQELSAVASARQMLHGIAKGELMVGTPIPDKADRLVPRRQPAPPAEGAAQAVPPPPPAPSNS